MAEVAAGAAFDEVVQLQLDDLNVRSLEAERAV